MSDNDRTLLLLRDELNDTLARNEGLEEENIRLRSDVANLHKTVHQLAGLKNHPPTVRPEPMGLDTLVEVLGDDTEDDAPATPEEMAGLQLFIENTSQAPRPS